MNVISKFIVSFLVLCSFSFSNVFSIDMCGVNINTNDAFLGKDQFGNTILAIDTDGDVFMQGSDHVGEPGPSSLDIGGARFDYSVSKVNFDETSQNRPSISTVGFVVAGSSGNVASIDSSGNLLAKGYIATNGSQAACPEDSVVCNGLIVEDRDYFCNVVGLETGSCTYNVINSENCATKPSFDSDGASNFDLPGYVVDYDGCSSGSCESTTYNDYCAGNIVSDYTTGPGGIGYGVETYDCNDLDVNYCVGLDRYVNDFQCGGSEGCENTTTFLETCVALGTSYGSWTCSDATTATRSEFISTATCSPGSCGSYVSAIGTEFHLCDPSEVCQAGSTTGCVVASSCSGGVAHLDSGDFYSVESVSFGDSCDNYKQPRSCFDGTLDGSISYNYSSCYVKSPSVCTDLSWAGNIAHGSFEIAFQSASVPYGSTCTSETRTCTNGNLGGSFEEQTCVVEPPLSCDGDLSWAPSIAHGSSVTASQSASVAYGSTCVNETRTCTNGNLGGGYTEQTCVVEPPLSCDGDLSWDPSIAHGSSVTAYQFASVPFGSTCTNETRTCSNDVLSGSFANQTCVVESAPSQDCEGSWNDVPGSCSVSCGIGLLNERYTIDKPASGKGDVCPFANGTIRQSSTSCNMGACAGSCNNFLASGEVRSVIENEYLSQQTSNIRGYDNFSYLNINGCTASTFGSTSTSGTIVSGSCNVGGQLCPFNLADNLRGLCFSAFSLKDNAQIICNGGAWEEHSAPSVSMDTCSDSILNGNEVGQIDCGGPNCGACLVTPGNDCTLEYQDGNNRALRELSEGDTFIDWRIDDPPGADLPRCTSSGNSCNIDTSFDRYEITCLSS